MATNKTINIITSTALALSMIGGIATVNAITYAEDYDTPLETTEIEQGDAVEELIKMINENEKLKALVDEYKTKYQNLYEQYHGNLDMVGVDVNNDGAIDAQDASYILQYSAYVGAGHDVSIETFMKSVDDAYSDDAHTSSVIDAFFECSDVSKLHIDSDRLVMMCPTYVFPNGDIPIYRYSKKRYTDENSIVPYVSHYINQAYGYDDNDTFYCAYDNKYYSFNDIELCAIADIDVYCTNGQGIATLITNYKPVVCLINAEVATIVDFIAIDIEHPDKGGVYGYLYGDDNGVNYFINHDFCGDIGSSHGCDPYSLY